MAIPLDVLLRRGKRFGFVFSFGFGGLVPRWRWWRLRLHGGRLLSWRAGLTPTPLRGNVLTRLGAFCTQGEGTAGAATALILAASGLERLELVPSLAAGSRHRLAGGLIAEALPQLIFLPAAGQGAIGICVAEGDSEALALAQAAESQASRVKWDAERSVLAGLHADCHTACAAFARLRDGAFVLSAALADPSPEEATLAKPPIVHFLETRLPLEQLAQENTAATQAGAGLARALLEKAGLPILKKVSA